METERVAVTPPNSSVQVNGDGADGGRTVNLGRHTDGSGARTLHTSLEFRSEVRMTAGNGRRVYSAVLSNSGQRGERRDVQVIGRQLKHNVSVGWGYRRCPVNRPMECLSQITVSREQSRSPSTPSTLPG
jgi:hypothetical protein